MVDLPFDFELHRAGDLRGARELAGRPGLVRACEAEQAGRGRRAMSADSPRGAPHVDRSRPAASPSAAAEALRSKSTPRSGDAHG